MFVETFYSRNDFVWNLICVTKLYLLQNTLYFIACAYTYYFIGSKIIRKIIFFLWSWIQVTTKMIYYLWNNFDYNEGKRLVRKIKEIDGFVIFKLFMWELPQDRIVFAFLIDHNYLQLLIIKKKRTNAS